jgi:predicted lipoprotein with Yx(FWY)xxD motif
MKNVFSLVMLFMFIVSCSSDDVSVYDPEEVIDDPIVVVENSIKLSDDSTFGSVLTNAEGFTLYFFAPDSKGNSNCNDGCATTWPAFNTSELTLDNGLVANDFSMIIRNDGTEQTTYKGWPLYLFSNDTAAGQINGDGASGVWFVAKPDYSIMIARSQLVGRNADGIESNLNSSFEAGDEETFYITDAEGNTLYHFVNDENGTNNFTNPDFSNNEVWPIFNTELQNVPSILNTDDFGVATVFDQTQLTYKGWPLYKFGGDENRGDNFGVGFPVAGIWPILNLNTEVAPNPEVVTPTVDKTFTVSNVGASAYVFGFTSVENPELELTRGSTYEFTVDAPGHPFIIKSAQGTGVANAFDEGVTNNGIASGKITFTVPTDAPDVLFYNCEFHGSMTGRIRIVDAAETSSFDVTNNGATSYVFTGKGFSNDENPNLNLRRGKTYQFVVNTPGHPFFIKSTQGTGAGNAFNDGVTNNGTSNEIINFTVPSDAPDTLFYNCEFHGGMTGTFIISD